MIKIIETTRLAPGLTSFRTEIIGPIDTSLSLQERYDYYTKLANAERTDPVRKSSNPDMAPGG